MRVFRKNRIRFRPLEFSDALFICRWVADMLGQSTQWERRFLHLLLEEWQKTEKLTRRTSWMAVSGDHRLFFLELSGEDQIFLTAPKAILENRITALAAWRLSLKHLRRLGTLPRIRVTLDRSRETECRCLLDLGFTEITANGNPRIFQYRW